MAEPDRTLISKTTSEPFSIPPQQQNLFREILSLLESRNIPFAVAGAFALQAHTGIHRDTKDLDVFLTSDTAQVTLQLLRKEGFVCEVCDPVWLFKAHRDGFFVDLITGMSNAVIVVDDSWIQRAKPAVVHDIPTRVLAVEELIASKLFVTRRERFDGVDIAHIIYRTRGKIDWQRVLTLAGDHWEMLFWALVLFHYSYPSQAQLVPQELWQCLTRRFEQSVSHPDSAAKFRGSLIDDKMFAIDVNEWGLDNLMRDYRDRRLQKLKRAGKKS